MLLSLQVVTCYMPMLIYACLFRLIFLNKVQSEEDFGPSRGADGLSQCQSDSRDLVQWPDHSSFKSVDNSCKFSGFTIAELNMYMMENDIARSRLKEVSTTGHQMFNEGFITSLLSVNSDQGIFLKGIVHAEMKKGLQYKVLLRLSPTGSIQYSDCECPAGHGPKALCKHIAATLFAVEHFGRTGKIVLLHLDVPTMRDQLLKFKSCLVK